MRIGTAAASLACLLGLAMPATARDAGAQAHFAFERQIIIDFPEEMQVWANARQDGTLRLSPSLPLEACRWGSDTQLACEISPNATLRRATRYDIAVAGGLKTLAGDVLPPLRLQADTERPRLDAQVVDWSGGLPKIVLNAAAGITPQAIASVLRLRLDGHEQALPMPRALSRRRTSQEWQRFELVLPPIAGKDRDFDLAIVPGLRDTEGPLPGVQDQVLISARVRDSYGLRAAACAGRATAVGAVPRRGAVVLDCTPGERVQLVFSAPPDEAGQRRFVAGLPAGVRALGWTAANDARWRTRTGAKRLQSPPYMLELVVDAVDRDVTFVIDDSLRDSAGESPSPVAVTVRTGGSRPRLEAAHARVLLLDVPRDAAVARIVNADAPELTLQSVAADARQGMLALPAAPGSDVEVVSAPTTRALRDGGWVRWRAQETQTRSTSGRRIWLAGRGALEFAAPAFDLLAVPGRREVLVWANEWTRDRAVAGAGLELLWQQDATSAPRRVASARTGDDGVAVLRLPEDIADAASDDEAGPRWWVRAKAGGRRAVLPIDAGMAGSLGTSPEVKTWGVSDRPLYRAGDTVHYRLWQRQDIGGRLATAPASREITVKLVDKIDGKVIDTWTAAMTADGALSGEHALPVHLTDSTYCIGSSELDRGAWVQGACFFVGTYRAQDLWVEAKSEDRVLRDGDAFVVDMSAGYYSGGPAAGVGIDRVSALLTGLPLQEAYPDWREYTFVDVFRAQGARDGIALAGADALATRADGEGRARLSLPVRFDSDHAGSAQDLPAFGRLRLAAQARPGDREGTMSNAASARYTRHARFVGLRLQPAWPDAEQPIALSGVVIDADGHRISGAPIDVDVQYRKNFGDRDGDGEDDDGVDAWTSIAHCTVADAAPAPCAVPRERTGRYRFVARSADAAAAEIERYIVAGQSSGESSQQTTVELLEAPAAPGAPIRLLVKQPQARTRALFVFANSDAVLGHRVETLDAPAAPVVLAADPAWRRSVEVGVYLRRPGTTPSSPSSSAGSLPAASLLRTPFYIEQRSISVDLPADPARGKPLTLAFAPVASMPGRTVRITLRNDSMRPRQVALTVIDDALHALAADFTAYADPQGPSWLGANRYRGYGLLSPVSYAEWNEGDRWHLWLPWPRTERTRSDPRCADANDCATVADAEGGLAPRVETDAVTAATDAADAAALAAQAAADAASSEDDASGAVATSAGEAGPNFIAQGEPAPFFQAVFGDMQPAPMADAAAIVAMPSPMDRPPPAPAPPPSPPREATLDRITVTGSGLTPVANYGPVKSGARPTADRAHAATAGDEATAVLPMLARVRMRFADTALWQPELALAPGETRTIDLVLPDNLTRWRAQAWSNDDGDDFDLAETTLDSGLPLEVRLQSPVRVYPGDRTRLAANVRQTGDAPATAETSFRFEGGDALAASTAALTLAPRGQASAAREIAPRNVGSLRVVAGADATIGHDAVAAVIDVATPWIEARRVQAGWLDQAPLALDLPALPAGARDVQLAVSLQHGTSALVDGWTRDLRDYPHRCWEQILSRAVAAALAIERGARADWPDADGAIREALDNAAVFQNPNGDFRYFADSEGYSEEVVLTAYSVRGLSLLRTLGYPVRAEVIEHARTYLARGDWRQDETSADAATSGDLDAFAAAESAALDAAQADALWRDFAKRSLPARVAAARALQQAQHPAAAKARDALLADAPVHGAARVLRMSQRYDDWMRSDLSEQCALIDLLRDAAAPDAIAARRMLLAGLTDLYAGGPPEVDTQAGATCLMALRGTAAGASSSPIAAEVIAGGANATLQLAADAKRADWTAPSASVTTLQIRRKPPLDAPASYVAELRYREDANNARAAAIGMAIDRRYEVLRDGRWTALATGNAREGDWLRITLAISTSAPRRFVAVTDAVPGGLRPTDLSLAGIAGLDLDKVSDTGSAWFATRRLDPRAPKFYAESLPAGRHEIHYFARVGNAGDYLAAPAGVELMYGEASNARTASQRLAFKPAD